MLISLIPAPSPRSLCTSSRSPGSTGRRGEEDAGLLGETVLGRALLFLGSTFQTAIFLVAIQSVPNKDSFQGQAGGKKKKKKKKIQVQVIIEESVPCKGDLCAQPCVSGKI